MRHALLARRLPVAGLLVLAGCVSFSTPRSADVRPGPAVSAHFAVAPSPGADAGWFWSYDCEVDCDDPIPAVDLGFAYGKRPAGGRPFSIGGGLSGTSLYADGFLQLGTGERFPFGLGARVGVPISGWSDHQLYGRLDVPLAPGARLLLNPALFVHVGESPNGQNTGSFVGFVQGIGLEIGTGPIAFTPGVAIVSGRSVRDSYGERIGPANRTFGSASLGVTFRRRKPPRA